MVQRSLEAFALITGVVKPWRHTGCRVTAGDSGENVVGKRRGETVVVRRS